MSMQFTLLGTGPASPIPRIYCSCVTCNDARTPDSRSRRSRSSALLTLGDKKILFDATPDVLIQLERTKTYAVDAVFFTHAHNDAAGGLFDLNDILRKQNHPVTLYAEAGTWSRLAHDLADSELWFKVKRIAAGSAIRVFGARITPFRVEHSAQPGFPTLGYRIGEELVYASDVKAVPKFSGQHIADVKHAVLDGCFWFNTHFPTHLTVDETIALTNRLHVKNLYLTQISHNYPPYPEATGAIRQYCTKNKITTKVTLAWDGMEIKLFH